MVSSVASTPASSWEFRLSSKVQMHTRPTAAAAGLHQETVSRSSTSQEAGDFLGQGKQREMWRHCGEPAFSPSCDQERLPGSVCLQELPEWPEGAPGKVLVLVGLGCYSGRGFGGECGLMEQSRWRVNSPRKSSGVRELGYSPHPRL